MLSLSNAAWHLKETCHDRQETPVPPIKIKGNDPVLRMNTKEQDEEADECVIVESQHQDERKMMCVRRVTEWLTAAGRRLSHYLAVTCGLFLACESAQSLSEECVALRDPVCKTEKIAFIDEPMIEYVYALIEGPLKPSATEGPSCRRAKQGREADRALCCKTSDERDNVCLLWQESMVKVVVPVPPHRRGHVISSRGDMIRQLQQQYPAVSVSVSLPQDLASGKVIIEGHRVTPWRCKLPAVCRQQTKSGTKQSSDANRERKWR
ncbi:hypothetical protein E2C01_028159 [Portunus trituberculatus]|uniref:K Homology domain-containing protein n=1 Tax=Portunus trituberculatus TaxID=210409 RepID=A0A5B7ENL2_PORTR|nr:hypothetical protein [Portunus trituberculatus]